jgi:hypothetical protein
MAKPRHKRDTLTFDQLSFADQAKSISAQVANVERAIRRHARHDRATDKTLPKCVRQVERMWRRLLARAERGLGHV